MMRYDDMIRWVKDFEKSVPERDANIFFQYFGDQEVFNLIWNFFFSINYLNKLIY